MLTTAVFNRAIIVAAFGGFLVMAAPGHADEPSEALHYEVTAVKRKLFLVDPPPESRLVVGATPVTGQALRTGSRSSAEIVQHEAAAPGIRAAAVNQRREGDSCPP